MPAGRADGAPMIEAAGLILVALLLIAGNALFVAAEFSLVAVEPHQVQESAEQGERRSTAVLGAIRSVSFQLSGAQLGITATSLAVGYIAEPAVATLLEPVLSAVALPEPPRSATALVIALVIATVTQMVFGELVPKNWAISEPVRVARAVAPAQVAFSRTFRPLIRLLNGAANGLLRLIGVEPQDELRAARSPAELGSIVASSAERGTLPSGTATLLRRSLRFGDRRTSDVMTPRVRTWFVAANASCADLLRLAADTGHSRFPVRRSGTGTGESEPVGVDSVVGVVNVKDVFRIPAAERPHRPVGDLMARPMFVPSSLDCDSLLARLRRGGQHLAVVIDEYGGTAGIVTLEDIVEELVGRVDDEHDRPAAPEAVPVGPGRWLVTGLLRLDEAAEATGVRLPAGPYDTIAGLVLARLGRLAEPGDEVEMDGHLLTVLSMDGLRIDQVRLAAASGPLAAERKSDGEAEHEAPAEDAIEEDAEETTR